MLDGSFAGARLGQCTALDVNSVVLVNRPEDEPPINHSPWYAFRVTEGQGGLQVRIDYAAHAHRYWPKVSLDGVRWVPLSAERVKQLDDGKSVVLNLDVFRTPMWVAGQEILDNAWYEEWYQQLESTGAFEAKVIGRSEGGREIVGLDTGVAAEEMLVLLGRAHPPEVTGALAMRHFVDHLVSEHAEFLARYRVIMVPQLNPDGVALGHWRHSLGSIDLNRDWGPFSQPETRAVRDWLESRIAKGASPIMMIDFHSTQRNLMYTQSEEEEARTQGFTTAWLQRAASMGVYPFEQQRRHNLGRPTAKNYFFERFGIPAVTYELGDETDREQIASSARVFADALVETIKQRQ